MSKDRIVILKDFFDELKTTEDLIDNNKEKAVNKDYVDGFKDCIEHVTRKLMETSLEIEYDEHGLEDMKVQSKFIH